MKVYKLLFLLPVILSFKFGIELEKRSVLNDKVELLMPKDWKQMKEELVAIKYPGDRPPQLVYSDISGAVSLAFNHTASNANAASLEKYKDVLKAGLNSAYPEAAWESEGIKEINGKKFGFFKVTTEAFGDKIYNYMLFTDVDGKLLILSFNCTTGKLKTWKPIAEQMMGSVVFRN